MLTAYIKRKENIHTSARTIALTAESATALREWLASKKLDLTATDFKVNKAGEYTARVGAGTAYYMQVLPKELHDEFYKTFGSLTVYPTKKQAQEA